MSYNVTTESKSTDKLAILCDAIKDKVLSDETLKNKVTRIEIGWGEQCGMVVPSLNIEFKQ